MRRVSFPTGSVEGSALIAVMVWCLALMALALVIVGSAVSVIQNSDHSERTYEALSAAEAGIEDYKARLQADDLYFMENDATNKALSAWSPVPGGTSQGEFTYSVDSSEADSAGVLTITSTGRSKGVYRTLKMTMRRPSTTDYVYMSNLETFDPDMPGIYQGTNYTTAMSQCADRYYWDVRGGAYRPTNASAFNCLTATIGASETIRGSMHTNDTWFLDGNADLSKTLPTTTNTPQYKITSACSTSANGNLSAPCTLNHLWMVYGRSSTSGLTSGERSATPVAWNPKVAPILPLPATNSKLAKFAEEGGCVFYGPTRIRLRTEVRGGKQYGVIDVTSPDTKLTRNICGGNALAGSAAAPKTQPTFTIDIDAAGKDFNGVIYVKASSSDIANPNYWGVSQAEPTCKKKSTSSAQYPYVVPSKESAIFSPLKTGDTGGFPSAQFGGDPRWYQCTSGDAFLQGELTGRLTIGAENNIALTGHTMYGDTPTTGTPGSIVYGMPLSTSKNALGLVPNNFLYTYNPVSDNVASGGGTKVTDWTGQQGTLDTAKFQAGKQFNVIYNFSTLPVRHCFGTQQWAAKGSSGVASNMGYVNIRGSLGQKYRCAVGLTGSAGYGKNYVYDDRFKFMSPPYMLSLSDVPWRADIVSETKDHLTR